ncbi:MAG: hypothetical protein QW735_00530 [archaeon]
MSGKTTLDLSKNFIWIVIGAIACIGIIGAFYLSTQVFGQAFSSSEKFSELQKTVRLLKNKTTDLEKTIKLELDKENPNFEPIKVQLASVKELNEDAKKLIGEINPETLPESSKKVLKAYSIQTEAFTYECQALENIITAFESITLAEAALPSNLLSANYSLIKNELQNAKEKMNEGYKLANKTLETMNKIDESEFPLEEREEWRAEKKELSWFLEFAPDTITLLDGVMKAIDGIEKMANVEKILSSSQELDNSTLDSCLREIDGAIAIWSQSKAKFNQITQSKVPPIRAEAIALITWLDANIEASQHLENAINYLKEGDEESAARELLLAGIGE